MNLALIGLRGAGKSVIGRLVAERAGREFVDLDDVTPRMLDATGVQEAWTRFGEESFRRAETVALAKTLSGEHRVIALGGGTPTAPLALELLEHEKSSGRLVVAYLAASAAALRARLMQTDNSHRPSLTGGDPLEEIEEVLWRRDGVYRKIADAVIETEGLDVSEITERVRSLLPGRG